VNGDFKSKSSLRQFYHRTEESFSCLVGFVRGLGAAFCFWFGFFSIFSSSCSHKLYFCA